MNEKTKQIGESYQKLYSDLPTALGKQCSLIENSSIASQKSENPRDEVNTFLETHVAPSERKEIDSELKKTFPLRRTKIGKIKRVQRRYTNKYVTARERRKLGLLRFLPKSSDNFKYSDFEGLNHLWKAYMRDLLDLGNYKPRLIEDPLQMKLCRADYHGALVKVTKAGCENHVGVEGFVVLETRNTFQIIDAHDKVIMIPKNQTSFSFSLDGYLFTISGTIMCCKPSDRAVKKWKNKPPFDF